MRRRLIPLLLCLLLSLPAAAQAADIGSAWNLKPAPDPANGGFQVLAEMASDSGDILALIRFDHEGQRVGDPIEITSPATDLADIATAENGLVVVAWYDDEGRIAIRTVSPDGEPGDDVVIESPADEAAPVVLLDPGSDDVVVLWHGYDEIWATWTTSVTPDGEIGLGRTCSEGWGQTGPVAFDLAFISDGTAFMLAEGEDDLLLTDFDAGLIGTDDDPIVLEDAGSDPTNTAVIFDYDRFAYMGAWTSEDDGQTLHIGWLDAFAKDIQLGVVATSSGIFSRPSVADAFDQMWMVWTHQDAGGFSVQGINPTGPDTIPAPDDLVAGGSNTLGPARLAYNDECPNLALFYDEAVGDAIEPRVQILQKEDPCDLGDDDDSVADDDDDDCPDADGDGTCDADDPCPDDARDRCGCGARASTAAVPGWTLLSILVGLLGTVALVRRLDR